MPVVREYALLVFGYPTVAEAGDAVASITPHEPIALEGMDRRLVRVQDLKGEHAEPIARLPDGNAWLLAQFGGETREEAAGSARRMLEELRLEPDRVRFLEDPEEENQLWQAREAGLGATAHVPGHRDTWEGWEDAGVPPQRLGD